MVRLRVALGALLSSLLVAQSALAGINFVGADLTSVAPQPDYIVSGRINDDEFDDVVVVSPASKDVATYLAAPSSVSQFAPARSVRLGESLRGVALGDLNRDNRLDVVVADQAANGVHVMLGRGDGTYQTPYLVPVANSRNPVGVAIGNFDESGAPDLAVIDRRENTVFILLNDNGSPPRFRRGGGFAVGLEPEQILAVDLNKDGKLDIVTLDLGGPRVKSVSVALFKRVTQGFPEFEPAIQYVAGENPSSMIAGDFNNDGTPDIAMLNRPAGTRRVSEIDVLLATGGGGLLPPPGIQVPCPFFTNGQSCKGLALASGDYDGNGNVDLVVAVTDPRSRGAIVKLVDAMQAFAGRGDGNFFPGPVFVIQKSPQALASGDLTGDGKPDVVVGSQRSLSLQAFINVGSPGGLANGEPCQTGDECLSTQCVNGVCCGSLCEANEVCNIPGREGTCVPESDRELIACEDEGSCPEEKPFCVDGACCDIACDGGSCKEPGYEGVCVPLLEPGAPCAEDVECATRFCSDNGVCCKERCDGGYCNELGVCSPLFDLGTPCGEDAQCESNVCDAFDQICCNRECLTNEEFCNPDGLCTLFNPPITPLRTATPLTVTETPTPTPTRTLRSTPAPTGDLCSVNSECQSNFCVNDVCCSVPQCGASEHCAEGTGQCVAGGTPTRTFTRTPLPTEPPLNPCEPNPCASGQKCVISQGSAVCVATSSSSGCSTSGTGGTGNLLVVAALPLLLWLGRRWQLQRAVAGSRRRR